MIQAPGTSRQLSGPEAPEADRLAGMPAAPSPYRATLRRLLPGFAGVLGISAILNMLMLTGSIYMLEVYDRVLGSGSVSTLIGLYAIVVVLYVFLGLYDFLRARMMARMALRLDRDCGADAFRQGLGPAAAAPGGAVLRDLDTLRLYLSSPAAYTLFDLPFMPLFLGVLFLIHPLFGWITLGGAAMTGMLTLLDRLLTRAAQARATTLDGVERNFSAHCRSGRDAILAMRMQRAVIAHWARLRAVALANGQAGDDPAQLLAATSRAFRMLLQSSILTIGAWLVIEGRITAGMIIASSILSGRALAPVDQLIGQSRSLGRALIAHRRLSTMLAPEGALPPALHRPGPLGEIGVQGLTVTAGDARILSGIEFRLDPGDGLGVIGRSASGKSTLARVLVGAHAPDSGEVRYDGVAPEQWDPDQLGRAIGYLPQQVEMLPGTIRDNIARFDPRTDDATVIEAARMAGVDAMILKLADGYATRLGDATSPRLSGGQIQRLGLARAICGKPAIVVLDEPNSNLDVDGDNALIDAVTTLRRGGSTVIVVAHRPSAIAAVNKLMILEDGTIRSFGDKMAVLAEVTGPVAPQDGDAPGRHAGTGPAAAADPLPPPRPTSPVHAGIARNAGPAWRRKAQ